MRELFFLTGNPGKFHEATVIFQDALLDINLQQDPTELVEIQSEYLENVAMYKLRYYVDTLGNRDRSCFAEDAGFFVTGHLNGFPGVYSAYVQKSIGNEAILWLMDGEADRTCHFSACIAFFSAITGEYSTFAGTVEGTVASEQRGTGGFGFDPIFIPDEMPEVTFAELSAEVKSSISHRGRALAQFISFLGENPDVL
ncbi:MAG TPA: RdgB/HAM1 family non-canonical purine NTP pyrophosphatase [Candidatus Lokiarchaeia archaeon]|nr:RdgB/HAM1 family non-canonical purine NTP pyrophosphatase [Candidatus Lokiarchaeia archaeon]